MVNDIDDTRAPGEMIKQQAVGAERAMRSDARRQIRDESKQLLGI